MTETEDTRTRFDSTLMRSERRAVLGGTAFRVVGTPLIALIGLLNTSIILRETGEAVFGLVSLVTTLSLLLPFADLGIGAVITSACSRPGRIVDDAQAVATVRRGARVLFIVAAVLISACLLTMACNGWGALLGTSSGPADRIAITIAGCMIALGIPAGIGVRILIGLDMNPLAVLITMANAVFTVAITALLWAVHAEGVWYAVSGAGGALLGNCIATAVALRRSGLGLSAFSAPGQQFKGGNLLTGSLWMFVASIGLPLGLQTHRLILSHFSTPVELSRYALMAQVYGIGWMVFSTAGMALWPVFVKRRMDTRASLQLWRRSVVVFVAVSTLAAAGILLLGPWATGLLSGGELVASHSLAAAFGALLVVQCFHLPAGVMLTMPKEARWQSFCIMAMGLISVGLGIWWGGRYGGPGVVLAAVVGVVLTQALPDLLWIPRLLARRASASDQISGDQV